MRFLQAVFLAINLLKLIVPSRTSNLMGLEDENNELDWQDEEVEPLRRRRLHGILNVCEFNDAGTACRYDDHYCKIPEPPTQNQIFVGKCRYRNVRGVGCCECKPLWVYDPQMKHNKKIPWTGDNMVYDGTKLKTTAHHRRGLQQSSAVAPECLGDPHFKTWSGEKYDFHGVCDLVLLHNDAFDNGIGMDIHVRTKKTRHWSYVSSAAIRIGHGTLEVKGGKDDNKYWVNGVKGDEIKDDEMVLSQTIAGYSISFHRLSEKSRKFVVHLGSNGEEIIFQTWNAFVRVEIHGAQPQDFEGSVGLLGKYPSGIKMGRDSSKVIYDLNLFGQDWQVLPEEPKLFHDIDGPQAPSKCDIPSSIEYRRRLTGTKISLEDAELACARVNKDEFDLCVFDVMALNDKNAAGAY